MFLVRGNPTYCQHFTKYLAICGGFSILSERRHFSGNSCIHKQHKGSAGFPVQVRAKGQNNQPSANLGDKMKSSNFCLFCIFLLTLKENNKIQSDLILDQLLLLFETSGVPVSPNHPLDTRWNRVPPAISCFVQILAIPNNAKDCVFLGIDHLIPVKLRNSCRSLSVIGQCEKKKRRRLMASVWMLHK